MFFLVAVLLLLCCRSLFGFFFLGFLLRFLFGFVLRLLLGFLLRLLLRLLLRFLLRFLLRLLLGLLFGLILRAVLVAEIKYQAAACIFIGTVISLRLIFFLLSFFLGSLLCKVKYRRSVSFAAFVNKGEV